MKNNIICIVTIFFKQDPFCLKINIFLDIFFVLNLILSKLCMNTNIINTLKNFLKWSLTLQVIEGYGHLYVYEWEHYEPLTYVLMDNFYPCFIHSLNLDESRSPLIYDLRANMYQFLVLILYLVRGRFGGFLCPCSH